MKNPGLGLVAAFLVICGGVFFFQGINLLKGSSMTGETQWAVIGGVMVVLGIGAALAALRPGKSREDF